MASETRAHSECGSGDSYDDSALTRLAALCVVALMQSYGTVCIQYSVLFARWCNVRDMCTDWSNGNGRN